MKNETRYISELQDEVSTLRERVKELEAEVKHLRNMLSITRSP